MNRGVSVWSSVGLCKFGRERHLAAAAAKLTLKTLSKTCLDTVFKIFDTNFCVIKKTHDTRAVTCLSCSICV